MTVPSWIEDAIFYQIFPDRFANGELKNDPPNVQPWNSPPTNSNFLGGDLRGIINHFDYLLDLGINAIYLNPIFQSTSNHRYNTTDYFKIDPKLGDMDDFRAFLDLAHDHGVRVILDGVFNHCGRGFYAFVDLLENQENSPYRNWFHPLRFPLEAYTPGESKNYLAWWGIKSLPKFNTDEPAVRQFILSVARYWIEQGTDGWRLDVPNEIDDDSFWAEFRRVVKTANPQAYLVGEIWTADPRWVGDSHFDGLMNYPLRECLIHMLRATDPEQAACIQKIERLLHLYPQDNLHSMYNTLGTHDTERIFSLLDGDVDKGRLAFLILFAFPGAPAIYYGDEIGMRGGKDPENRGAFPWDENQWNHELRNWVKTLISTRQRTPALRRGEFVWVYGDDIARCYAFARLLGDESLMVALNASPSQHSLRLPVSNLGWEEGKLARNLLTPGEFPVSQEALQINLPPWSGIWLA
jgi:cyclomaltodextrinase